MEVERPEGHVEVVSGLWRAASANRLPHGLQFVGPAGIGKFAAAVWFIQGLLCSAGPGEPCGVCGPCKRIASGGDGGNHPDVLVIDPVTDGEETIKLARIAERDGAAESAEAFLRLRPAEGGRRAVLIREAERMQVPAQNALLKTLEEPAAGTVLILVCDRPERLLETIQSRVVRVPFEPLDAASTARILEREGVEEPERSKLASWSRGSPGEALRLARQGAADMRELWVGVVTGSAEPLAAAAALWEIDASFTGGTPRAQARGRARTFLDLGLEFHRDAQRAHAGLGADELAQGEAALELAQGPISLSRLRSNLERLLLARRDIDANLSPEAVVERALLGLAPRQATS